MIRHTKRICHSFFAQKELSTWSVSEKSFPQPASPTLRYILPSFGCRSPARYAALIRIKSPTNWDSQLTKSLFQTRYNSHIRVSMFDDRIEILLFILLRTAYWTAFNLPDVEFIVIGRSLTRISVRYKLIDS